MLTDSEINRCKMELGYNLLSNGAAPWVEYDFIFTQVIQPNLSGGASTTSTTSVVAQSVAIPVTLTLASATGFHMFDRVVIDVDDRAETCTVQSVSGSTIKVLAKNAHTGTYPVVVEGPETLVREILRNIRETKDKLAQQFGTGALKKVDEIEFYDAKGKTSFGILGENLAYYREQLASALGIESLWSANRSASATVSVY